MDRKLNSQSTQNLQPNAPKSTIYPRQIQHHNRWDEFHDDEIVDWKRIRALIEHENQLINHRMTWLLLLQAALFSVTESSLIRMLKEGRTDDTIVIMPAALIGFLVSLFITLTISQAEKLIHESVSWWKQIRLGECGDASKKYHPDLFPALDWISHSHKYTILGFMFTVFWATLFWGGLISLEMQWRLNGLSLVRSAGFIMLISYGAMVLYGIGKEHDPGRGQGCKLLVGVMFLLLIVMGSVMLSPFRMPKCNILRGIYSCQNEWHRSSIRL